MDNSSAEIGTPTDLASWLLTQLTPMICLADIHEGQVIFRGGEWDHLVAPGDCLSDMAPPETVQRLYRMGHNLKQPALVQDLLFRRTGGGQIRFSGRLRSVSYEGRPCLLMAMFRPGVDSKGDGLTPGVWLDMTRQGVWIGDLEQTIFMNRPLQQLLSCGSGQHLVSCCVPEERQKLERIMEDLLSDDPMLEGQLHSLCFTVDGDRKRFTVYPMSASGTRRRAVQLVFLDTEDFLFSVRFHAYHLELDRRLNRFAFTFIREGWGEPVIQRILAEVGALMNVTRAFLFRVRSSDGVTELTHEWRAPGVSSALDRDPFPYDSIQKEWTTLAAGSPLVLQSPGEAGDRVREVMEAAGVRAVLLAPLMQRGELVGAIGVSEVRFERLWIREEQTFLITLGQLLGLARERRDLEGRLRSALREARESAGLKEKFLSTVSHEVRNPLNAIIGLSAILKRDAWDRLTEEERKMLTFIDENGMKLLNTMEHVLYLSRLKQAAPVPRPAWFNLRELTGDLESYMTGRLFGRENDLTFDLDMQHVPEQLYGDRELVSRVLINLLDNAVKFTASGTVRLSIRRNGRSVGFEVSDTGIGISDEHLDRIFTEFFQVDDVATRRFEGVGVGLSIVKALVDAMAGEITVESQPGAGTRFSVNLPLILEKP